MHYVCIYGSNYLKNVNCNTVHNVNLMFLGHLNPLPRLPWTEIIFVLKYVRYKVKCQWQ